MPDNVVDVKKLYLDVNEFYNTGKIEKTLTVPLVFPIQTININIRLLRFSTVFKSFKYAVRQVKLYKDNLVKITYNGTNSQSYITDIQTSQGFIDMFNKQNNIINNLLLQQQNQ
jgi:hypothetical protein